MGSPLAGQPHAAENRKYIHAAINFHAEMQLDVTNLRQVRLLKGEAYLSDKLSCKSFIENKCGKC
jgi:hypothetical protein